MEHTGILSTENEASLILEVLKYKAYEYLESELIKQMKDDMKKIASDAVTQWAEVRLSNGAGSPMDSNINITFIEHIVKTQFRDNPIKINVKP